MFGTSSDCKYNGDSTNGVVVRVGSSDDNCIKFWDGNVNALLSGHIKSDVSSRLYLMMRNMMDMYSSDEVRFAIFGDADVIKLANKSPYIIGAADVSNAVSCEQLIKQLYAVQKERQKILDDYNTFKIEEVRKSIISEYTKETTNVPYNWTDPQADWKHYKHNNAPEFTGRVFVLYVCIEDVIRCAGDVEFWTDINFLGRSLGMHQIMGTLVENDIILDDILKRCSTRLSTQVEPQSIGNFVQVKVLGHSSEVYICEQRGIALCDLFAALHCEQFL